MPSSADVKIEAMPLSTFACLEFPGEATGIEYAAKAEEVKAAVTADGLTLAPASDVWAEAWLGYDAPNDIFRAFFLLARAHACPPDAGA